MGKTRKLEINQELRSYILSSNLLIHLIEIMRKSKWSDEEISETVIQMLKNKEINLAYHGSYIFGHIISMSDKEWKQATTEKSSVFYSFVKANYRMGYKKKELERLRHIMRLIQKGIDSCQNINYPRGYRNMLEWCFLSKKV